MLDQAMSVLKSSQNKVLNADEVFGQSVGLSLQNVSDKQAKEFAKVKIQEILFKAQFGILPIQEPSFLQNESAYSRQGTGNTLSFVSPQPTQSHYSSSSPQSLNYDFNHGNVPSYSKLLER